MKEIPIIYSAPMVRALLAGRKTQTRRVCRCRSETEREAWGRARWLDAQDAPEGNDRREREFWETRPATAGGPGDVHWVKETFTILSTDIHARDNGRATVTGVYPADGAAFEILLTEAETDKLALWKRHEGNFPAIFMFRSLSRIRRMITEVRVQRLQEITEDDARAEGITFRSGGAMAAHEGRETLSQPEGAPYVSSFLLLWIDLHGPDSWEENPFVRAFTFRRLKIDT